MQFYCVQVSTLTRLRILWREFQNDLSESVMLAVTVKSVSNFMYLAQKILGMLYSIN